MENYSEKYIARCLKKLKSWNAPLVGWICEEVIDTGDAYETCKLCGCPSVRYLHVMHHDDYFESVEVGCICAGIMEGDIIAAQERERQIKNRKKRRITFIDKVWAEAKNGSIKLKFKGRFCLICKASNGYGISHYYGYVNGIQIRVDRRTSFSTLLSLKNAMFDYFDPPLEYEVYGR